MIKAVFLVVVFFKGTAILSLTLLLTDFDCDCATSVYFSFKFSLIDNLPSAGKTFLKPVIFTVLAPDVCHVNVTVCPIITNGGSILNSIISSFTFSLCLPDTPSTIFGLFISAFLVSPSLYSDEQLIIEKGMMICALSYNQLWKKAGFLFTFLTWSSMGTERVIRSDFFDAATPAALIPIAIVKITIEFTT